MLANILHESIITYMENLGARQAVYSPGSPEVVTFSLAQQVIDYPDDYAFTRRGVSVQVLQNDEAVFARDVWQRGIRVPTFPFYEKRLARAISKAEKVAGVLMVGATAEQP